MNNSTTETRERLVNDAAQLKQAATQVVTDVKDHATAHVDAVKQKADDSHEALREYVKQHLFAVLGGVFAIGYVLGASRRR